VEIFEHRKLPLQDNLCQECYTRERTRLKERENVAKTLRDEGRSFREVFRKEPDDPSWWQ
jgi:hypothetical protein